MENGRDADPRFAPSTDARQTIAAWSKQAWFDNEPFPRVLVWDEGAIRAFVYGFPRAALPVVDLEPTVRIGDLFVEPSARRRGIGKQLVEAMLARAERAGFPRAEVGTLARDERAVAFWSSVGFAPWQVHLSRTREGA